MDGAAYHMPGARGGALRWGSERCGGDGSGPYRDACLTKDAGATFQLRLINAQGRLILEQTLETSAAENDLAIPVAKLAPGVYEVILLRNGVAVGRARVVKT